MSRINRMKGLLLKRASAIAPLVSGFAAALLGALLFQQLRMPLPWMLGPIVSVAVMQLLIGRSMAPLPAFRGVAQVGLGVAIGLAFQPEVARIALASWPIMLATALGAIAIGWLGTWFFHRIVGLDVRTSYFSAAIGGAWEMHTLAERYGARADMVAAAHVLRISMVVLLVPNVFALAGVRGHFESGLGHHIPFSIGGLLALAIIACTAAWGAARRDIPNAYVLGPLIVTAALTGSGIELSSMPKPMVWAAQLLMGWSMGSKFSRQFFLDKPWFLITVAAYTLAAMLLSACWAYGLAIFFGNHTASLILGTAPGGVAEMSLTAAALKLDVPLVTSLHLVRVICAALLIGLIFRIFVEPRLSMRRTSDDPAR